jgi:SAM-dependent methyltransferase
LLAESEIGAYYLPAYHGEIDGRIDEYLAGTLQRSRSWRGELEKARLVERYVPRGRILDVGCGDGKFLWALDPGRWERFGVERSEQAVQLVQRRIPGLLMTAGDIHSQALEPGCFDAVTFWHVLEHLPDPVGVLKRTAALLRPGAWVFISLPSIDSLQACLFRGFWYGFDDVPRHLHHFSRRSLDLLLGQTGFAVHRHLMFSPLVNFHALKHSLLNWSVDRFSSRLPYYALEPLLVGFQSLERISGRCGIRTVIARTPPRPGMSPAKAARVNS